MLTILFYMHKHTHTLTSHFIRGRVVVVSGESLLSVVNWWSEMICVLWHCDTWLGRRG